MENDIDKKEALSMIQKNRNAQTNYAVVSNDIKAEAMQKEISFHNEMLKACNERGKIDIREVDDLKKASVDFLNLCSEFGALPTMEKFACFLGLSRIRLFQFIQENRYPLSVEHLEYLKTFFASVLASQCLSRNLSEVFGIFVLKNSSCGFRDKVEIEAVQDNRIRPSSDELIENAKLLP